MLRRLDTYLNVYATHVCRTLRFPPQLLHHSQHRQVSFYSYWLHEMQCSDRSLFKQDPGFGNHHFNINVVCFSWYRHIFVSEIEQR